MVFRYKIIIQQVYLGKYYNQPDADLPSFTECLLTIQNSKINKLTLMFRRKKGFFLSFYSIKDVPLIKLTQWTQERSVSF